MTKQQILAEIAAKIDGQGSAIDAGSALPGILRGIIDLIPAEQVNSDWDATEGPAEILNKPTIPANIVTALDVTEDMEMSELTQSRFWDIAAAGILSFQGRKYILSSSIDVTSSILTDLEADDGRIFVASLTVKGTNIDALEAIVLYTASGHFEIRHYEM